MGLARVGVVCGGGVRGGGADGLVLALGPAAPPSAWAVTRDPPHRASTGPLRRGKGYGGDGGGGWRGRDWLGIGSACAGPGGSCGPRLPGRPGASAAHGGPGAAPAEGGPPSPVSRSDCGCLTAPPARVAPPGPSGVSRGCLCRPDLPGPWSWGGNPALINCWGWGDWSTLP